MVERLPDVEVRLPTRARGAALVIWHGEPIAPDALTVDDVGTVQIVVAGVTDDEHNVVLTVLTVRQT